VDVGERVKRGEVLGYVGSTGYSTGCHLHFMVYENGVTVDPMSWL
jgi:murein DD-endopeptidase MepM/ murein hydrolase activator NlpD